METKIKEKCRHGVFYGHYQWFCWMCGDKWDKDVKKYWAAVKIHIREKKK